MKTILAIGATLAYSFIFGFCNLPQNPDEYRQWERESLDAIKAQEKALPNEAIPKLGRWINKLSDGANVEAGARPVFLAAQSALLAIPGHAKYYQDQIEKTREFVKYYNALPEEEQEKIRKESLEEEARRHTPAVGLTDRLSYGQVCYNAFEILSLLPSPEAVAVLGHYVEDPEGRDGKDLLGNPIYIPGSDVAPALPNCNRAGLALGKLGIEHPPYPAADTEDVVLNEKRVDAWKQWWSEIKAGRRTYRFIGSPIEYCADGPATPEQIEKIRQARERDEKRAKGHDRPMGNELSSEKAFETKKPSNLFSMLIATAAAMLVSIVWYVGRKKS